MTQDEFNIAFLTALCNYARYRFIDDEGNEQTQPTNRLEIMIGDIEHETWIFEFSFIEGEMFLIDEMFFDEFISMNHLDENITYDWIKELLQGVFGLTEYLIIEAL